MNAQASVRAAVAADAAAMAVIYNQGIEDRVATFETRPRTAAEVLAWIDGDYPCVVVERAGSVLGFAAGSAYRARDCYRGVCEFSVYVERAARGTGAGRTAMLGLCEAAAAAGCWKLVSRLFPENAPSRRLLSGLGFREVGVYRRHARLDGAWRDVIIVEKLLQDAL